MEIDRRGASAVHLVFRNTIMKRGNKLTMTKTTDKISELQNAILALTEGYTSGEIIAACQLVITDATIELVFDPDVMEQGMRDCIKLRKERSR